MQRVSLKTKLDNIPEPEEIKFGCLDIRPLDTKLLNEEDSIDNVVLRHPFFAILLGPSRSGKTTTWMNILKNPSMLYKKFEQVYYFIPTWHSDDIYTKNIDTEDEFVIQDYSPDVFDRIIRSREMLIEAHKKKNGEDASMDGVLPPTLFVVDDNVGSRFLSSRMFTMLDVLATKGRKFNISVIVAIQFMRNITSPVVRGNATDIFIYNIPNAEEQKEVLKEFQGSVEATDILKMYRSCFKYSSDKYNFFYISNFVTNNRIKFRKNLNTILIPPSLSEKSSNQDSKMGCQSCTASSSSLAKPNGIPATRANVRGMVPRIKTKTGPYVRVPRTATRL